MAKKKDESKNLPGDLADSAHKIWLAGLGALAVAEAEGGKAFRKLVERGEDFERRGRAGIEKMKDSVGKAADKARGSVEGTLDKVGGSFDDRVADALHRIGVPTREEISTLTKRVEELTKAVEKARQGEKAGAKAGAKK